METAVSDATAALASLKSRKVCVVGAGMAGLMAARELRREGHSVTVMEQRGGVGGQWLYDPRTDERDPLGVTEPVRVHGSMYASVRLLTPREAMGVSDFQFLPSKDPGRDPRRFPCHREVLCYLKDFCDAFGIMDAVRLNTRVVRVAMAVDGCPDMGWLVRSVRVGDLDDVADSEEEEEAFDAVVVANGHYSQPRLPAIPGMAEWRRRHLHSHSYREPDAFRGEVVVLVGCGDSGMDIALDLVAGVAKAVHLAASSVDRATATPAMSKMLRNHAGVLHLHPRVERLHDDGTVEFADGTSVAGVDSVVYCTGYRYSFPFLDAGLVAVDKETNLVGPLFEHTFPPALAPWLSFAGVHRKIFVPWFFEAQGRWVARALSGRSALTPPDEMLRAVEEYYRAREEAGVPARYGHDIGGVNSNETHEFVVKYTDLPPLGEWKMELRRAFLRDIQEDRENFRDVDNDSETVREGVRSWLRLADDHAPPPPPPRQAAAAHTRSDASVGHAIVAKDDVVRVCDPASTYSIETQPHLHDLGASAETTGPAVRAT